MAGPLQQAGAISDPSRFAALSMSGEEFTGMWTQAGPYRDAASAYLTRKFYSGSRFDRIIDGANREISSKLTDVRRPGIIPFNTNVFGAVRSFYSFKFIQDGVEKVKVMLDTDAAVYDASNGGKVLVYTKPAGSGQTRFLSIGPILYMGNGKTQVKWVQSSKAWQPATNFPAGTVIVDSNGNLQEAVGAQTANIANVALRPGPVPGFSTITIYFSPLTPMNLTSQGPELTFAGMTTYPAANGTTLGGVFVDSSIQIHFNTGGIHTVALSPETGTATTGTGITGGSQPAWASTIGAQTQDGGAQWICKGSALQNWGGDAPTAAPTVTQAKAPTIYPDWTANTWYAPLFVLVDTNGNLEQLTTKGITGGAQPAWNVVVGGTTPDNTAVWTNLGPGTWSAISAKALGALLKIVFSYTITYTTYSYDPVTHQVTPQTRTQTITTTNLFKAIVAGNTGATEPSWTNGLNTIVIDGGVTWQNVGLPIAAWGDFGAAQALETANAVVGAGYIQQIQGFGKSAATAPTWNTVVGGTTADGGGWLNAGAISAGTAAGAWIYGYSGKNSVTGEITTSSPPSQPIVVLLGNLPVIQGVGLADTQFDQLVLWRTTQGESTLIKLDTIPNPGAGNTWIYTDTTSDTGLNAFQTAPIDNANDPPPVGATGPSYYLQRVWIFKDNILQYSQTPGSTTGSSASAFAPANNFTLQAQIIKTRPINVQGGALLVYSTSGIFIILGSGTATDPFFLKQYAEKINLLNYDAEDVFGTEIFLMESNYKTSSITVQYPFNPQSGYTEVGYPIGDQFLNVNTGLGPWASGNLYQSFHPYVSWNPNSTQDSALYVADGGVGWFRMSMVSPPESGIVWSPRAAFSSSTSAVQNVETAPGVFNLLIGGTGTGGGTPILMRETYVTGFAYQDFKPSTSTYAAYESWDVKGVNLLNPTGEVTEVAHIATKSLAVGKRPIVSVLLGEIKPSPERPYNALDITGSDPALTPKSKSVYSDQYDLLQNGVAVQSDSILTKFDYQAQAFGDELLDWGIFAGTENERKETAEAAR
jgi:hypothetical protein